MLKIKPILLLVKRKTSHCYVCLDGAARWLKLQESVKLINDISYEKGPIVLNVADPLPLFELRLKSMLETLPMKK